MKIPYDHQEKVHKAIWQYVETTKEPGVVVCPVASGKSYMMARFSKSTIDEFPNTRVIILAHVAELLVQTMEELVELWPFAPYGFYADKLKSKDLEAQIIIASIQSIYNKAFEIIGGVDIVLIDECHLIGPKETTIYRKFLNDLLTINPHARILGFTGTNFRANKGLLTEGEDRLFHNVIYQIPMLDLINKGILCPLITPQDPLKTRMSAVGVGTRDGDYITSQLSKAVDKEEITKACVDEIIERGNDRKKWIVFTVDIEHCTHVRDEIRARGIKCEMVTGKTPTGERDDIFSSYEDGDLQCLVNVAVATTGYNNPKIDMIVWMRPMKSAVLYVQTGGRGMRIHASKSDCLALDFGGVIEELGPIDTIDARIVQKGTGVGEAPIKNCPQCKATVFAGVKICPDCEFQFPFEKKELKTAASNAAILSIQAEKPFWNKVISTQHSRHKGKNGKKDTLRAKYITYTGDYSQFVCIEHIGFAREKACVWHRVRLPNVPMPSTIDEALGLKYPNVSEVLIQKNGKYFEILAVKLSEDAQDESQPPEMLASSNVLMDCEDIPF